MNIKGLLFSLFLYVCLVWVGAAYLRPQEIQRFGLLWTALGLAAVLVFILGARVLNWWRVYRVRKAAVRPAPLPKPVEPIHEDNAALAALVAEANSALAKAPGYAAKGQKTPLAELPLYLLVGPEGSGKTSTFVNSGLEPQLLAGQVTGSAPVVPTRICNLWLAKNSIFAEISGRVFNGELARWNQLLKLLQGKSPVPFWRRVWREPEQVWHLRGVIAFCETKEFIGAALDPQGFERHRREWQERLRAIGETFGVEFPVYQVFTKCDAIPYFRDFFRRLPEPDANQILGCTLPIRRTSMGQPAELSAQAEAKGLTASFRPLFQALAERRLTHLAHEPDPMRRPGIYEFPRELKRIRSPLVQFLTDVFRPHLLQPGPRLRGYYLTGIREVELTAPLPGGTRTDWSTPNAAMDGTRLFRGDMTLASEAAGVGGSSNVARSRLTPSWLFVSDLFHKIILRDPPLQRAAPVDTRFELYRQVVFGAVCALCLLLCCAFVWSWSENGDLLHAIEQVRIPDTPKAGAIATVDELKQLDDLRLQVATLARYKRRGRPWSLGWGLYSGNRLLDPARTAYFRRFGQLLLNDLNQTILAKLIGLPATPSANDAYDPIHDELKTHLIISSGACKAEPALVSRVLKQADEKFAQSAGSDWQVLAEDQIEFYASELPYGNPAPLPEDVAARDHARQYLRQVSGVDKIYESILASAEKAVPKSQQLAELAPNYAKVLSGPSEVRAVFTPAGWSYIQKASKDAKGGMPGEACVVGPASVVVGELGQNREIAGDIQRLYLQAYADYWRKFVSGFSVVHYGSAGDAAQKLDILSGYKSPLLALLYLTSKQTDLQTPQAASEVVQKELEKVPVVGKMAQRLEGAGKTAQKLSESQTSGPDRLSSPADVRKVFQPVQWVVPPDSQTWLSDKNSKYMDALAQLGRSMQQIARGGDNPDPAAEQAADQSYENARNAVRDVANGFQPLGDQGVDETVRQLLLQPIEGANHFIIRDMEAQGKAKINQKLQALCASLRSALRKYPFQPSSPDDTSLEELASWFDPSRGGIWKFQAETLGELTTKEGSQWKSKDPTKKPQVTQEMLAFLNRAQAIADVFYPAGATQPHLTYILRPKLDSSFGASILELEIDGRVYQWTSSLQKQFTWPPPPDVKTLGVTALIRSGNLAVPFASFDGIWGIFRLMGDAEPRALSSSLVEWKYTRGTAGRSAPIQPAPVSLEIVQFPGGVDVFSPRFFGDVRCPARAVE